MISIRMDIKIRTRMWLPNIQGDWWLVLGQILKLELERNYLISKEIND